MANRRPHSPTNDTRIDVQRQRCEVRGISSVEIQPISGGRRGDHQVGESASRLSSFTATTSGSCQPITTEVSRTGRHLQTLVNMPVEVVA
jgi:hypothetical protein